MLMFLSRMAIFKRLLLSMLILVIICLAAWTGFRMLLTHRPPAYNPRDLTPWEQERAADEQLLKINEFYNAVHELRPFRITLTEDFLNGLLLTGAPRKYWDDVVQRSENRLGLPQIALADGILSLMVLVDHPELQSVLTVSVAPRILGNQELRLAVEGIRAGRVPVPKRLLQQYLSRLTDALRAAQDRHVINPDAANPAPAGRADERAELMAYLGAWAAPALIQLVEEQEVTIPNEFALDMGRQARIVAVTVRPEGITFDLQPYVAAR